uniref:Uncharacterized protein n=1 Tax=Knipowitschia caucasica TaxID=637954 RepID=A0AAV2LRM6_KNICA
MRRGQHRSVTRGGQGLMVRDQRRTGSHGPGPEEDRASWSGTRGGQGLMVRDQRRTGPHGCSQSQSSTLKRTLTNHCLVKSP